MRKTIIALMLVLPLMFVFVVFSSVNIASLGVQIAANGISIVNKSEIGSTLRIDLASQNVDEQKLEVAVSPENASNKGYTFRVEEVEGSDLADITVSQDGVISASSEGAARICAVSNDGGYRDSVTVYVGSSKAYDFDLSLADSEGDVALNVDENGNYFANVNTGAFTYSTKIYPSGFTVANVSVTEGAGVTIDLGAKSVLVPFSGQAVLTFTVPNGVSGDIVKTLTLNATKGSAADYTINGSLGNIITLAEGARTASFYVESSVMPTLSADFGIENVNVTKVLGADNGYLVYVTLSDNVISDFTATLVIGEQNEQIEFTFKSFDFSLSCDLDIVDSGYSSSVSVLNGTPITFYAVAAVAGEDISYLWGVDSVSFDGSIIDPSDKGTTCVLSTDQNGTFVLWVEAYRGGVPTGISKEITVTVISRVYGVQIDNVPSADLAARYTIGGYKYDELGNMVANSYKLNVNTFYSVDGSGTATAQDLVYTLSDTSKASVLIDQTGVYLVPQGTGEVAVTFAWLGNQSFGTNYTATVTLNVVRNGVEVNNAPDLVTATKAGVEVVLTDDIMLGTDKDGNVLDIATRRSMLGSMKSTYNIEWYKHGGNNMSEADAYVKYVLEFKDDVYGNGHFINAEYFTNAKDGTGAPLLYKGPLFLVSMGIYASVAGQDNIAFLIRTDGVTLYGVNLLGCSDESLSSENGDNDLAMLNLVGNVLEVNADADLVNCRIRNGRNVVRVYGGNRDGNKYFIDSLSENQNGIAEEDRIKVRIEGCIISQGREFLVKVGANRALRASIAAGGQEPDLVDQNGNPYSVQTNNYLNDEYFYQHYVMTDVTLKDSVLETSGLFAIGVEANFAGGMLYKDMDSIIPGTEEWLGCGGTSFASILRFEGDVKIYDWKDISLVDSSTLIESQSSGGISEWLKLNISAMIQHVQQTNSQTYGSITANIDGKTYVHGGMAIYGGGKNYAQISFENMSTALSDFAQYDINITVLADSSDAILNKQGSLLPTAAGSQDFRFYMYDANSANSYAKQINDGQIGAKYNGVKSTNVF